MGERWRIGEARFTNPLVELVATSPDEVVSVIDRAEAHADAGKWVVGYVSYDASPGLVDHLSVPTGDDGSVPLAWFGVYESATELDSSPAGARVVGPWEPSMTRSEHALRIARIKEAIRAGETYQVNLTMALRSVFDGEPRALFQGMVRSQPKSYGSLIDLGSEQIVSISPELFFSIEDRVVTMRPMKGTAPRGRSSAEDYERRMSLESSDKERAGNVMIVDMLRNDLGRVAETGSVNVPKIFEAERHPTVWQLTSTVESRLEEGVSLSCLFKATFPSGSVTGAPKVATMSIISDLEPVRRGVYCGAIGYIEPGAGRSEFAVAIRTGIVSGDSLTYHVGGGITVDSDADFEYDECLWKALVVTSSEEKPDLLETMRYEPGVGIPLLEGHLRRLASSAAYWGIPLDLTSIGEALSALEGHRPLKVRLILHRDGEVEVEQHDLEPSVDPVPLKIASGRIDPSDPLWYHKTADRDRYPELDDSGEETVLVNLDGEVTETNISNLMVLKDGRWTTPAIASGCLPGVVRAEMLESGEVTESRLTVEDLRAADDLAVMNAVRGFRKAKLIE